MFLGKKSILFMYVYCNQKRRQVGMVGDLDNGIILVDLKKIDREKVYL